jgi:transposase
MRKIKEVVRLAAADRSRREIAQAIGVARSTISDYLKRAERAGVGWPEAAELDEAALERALFPPPPAVPAASRPWPDFAVVHRELKRKGVTLFLLWEEYKASYPDGFQYSWFCQHYRAFASKVDVVMRQTHRAGEKTFVDYAGQTVEVVDPTTGEVREAQVFVAVLGASSFTYAEATWTQGLGDWIGSHQRTFRFFDGVTDVLVPDNLRSGVTRAHRYEPDLNPTYAEMAAHYSITILPARVRKPRDKAKVEVAVQIVERWILSRLRHQTFFSLDEVNRAIAELLPLVNERPFKKLPGSRRTLYEQLDRPALAPLPAERYEFATWKKARVNIDYHIELERHYYSVPYQLVKLEVEARLTESTVEILHRGRRVASHRRSFKVGGFTTVAAHMPRPHRDYAEWTPKRLVRWAEKTGHATAELVEAILSRRRHPQQGFRSCLGLFRLGQDYGEARLEAACRRALHIGALSYKSIESILKHKLDQEPLPDPAQPALPLKHDNVRGPKYYH